MVAYRRPTHRGDWLYDGFGRLRLGARKAWSRHLAIGIFVLIIVYASVLGALNVLRHTIMWRAIVNASLFGCAATWYFYFKPNVAAYFRELAKGSIRKRFRSEFLLHY